MSGPRAVPFIDLSRTTSRLKADVLSQWSDVLDKNEFVGGARVAALEKRLCAILGVPRTVACANGTDALIIGLQVLGVRPGMKVAVPNLTFWATYEAVAQLGATPVLVDVDADDLQLSLDGLKRAHERYRFEAAVFVHLFGWTSARLGEIRAFCRERSVKLLEDGAQCFGVEVNGAPVLTGADVATLSFYPAKVVGGALDGGAITVRTEAQEQLARSLCNHGRVTHYSHMHVGWNSRMGGVQAAFLLRVLDEVPVLLKSRRHAAARTREALANMNGVRVHRPPAGVVENGYLSVLTVDNAPAVADALKERGIGTGRTYPETLADQAPAKDAIIAGDLGVSRDFCKRVLNLPLFYGILDDEVDAAVRALQEVLREGLG